MARKCTASSASISQRSLSITWSSLCWNRPQQCLSFPVPLSPCDCSTFHETLLRKAEAETFARAPRYQSLRPMFLPKTRFAFAVFFLRFDCAISRSCFCFVCWAFLSREAIWKSRLPVYRRRCLRKRIRGKNDVIREQQIDCGSMGLVWELRVWEIFKEAKRKFIDDLTSVPVDATNNFWTN